MAKGGKKLSPRKKIGKQEREGRLKGWKKSCLSQEHATGGDGGWKRTAIVLKGTGPRRGEEGSIPNRGYHNMKGPAADQEIACRKLMGDEEGEDDAGTRVCHHSFEEP